jgi:hypothetical protein
MLTTVASRYLTFVALLGVSTVTVMFAIEPKIILPSIVGMVLLIATIALFFRFISQKSEAEQQYIAKRNGKIAEVLVVILLALFFIAAARYNNISVIHFIRLWFG